MSRLNMGAVAGALILSVGLNVFLAETAISNTVDRITYHTQDDVKQWASDLIMSYQVLDVPTWAKDGPYDRCVDLSTVVKTDGRFYGPDGRSWVPQGVDDPKRQPLFVDFNTYGSDVATACAVMLNGGEW